MNTSETATVTLLRYDQHETVMGSDGDDMSHGLVTMMVEYDGEVFEDITVRVKMTAGGEYLVDPQELVKIDGCPVPLNRRVLQAEIEAFVKRCAGLEGTIKLAPGASLSMAGNVFVVPPRPFACPLRGQDTLGW